MLEAVHSFYSRGWLVGTCGNLSIQLSQDPYRLLVTPSGQDKSSLHPHDLLVVDQQGSSLKKPGRASAELCVHQEIYRLSQARAIYHVHSIANNLASRIWFETGFVPFEGVEMIKGIAGKTLHDRIQLAIVPNSQDMQQLARSVADAVSPQLPAVLVYQHGIYAWGTDPAEARRHVEIFEFLLEYAVQLHHLGLSPRHQQ